VTTVSVVNAAQVLRPPEDGLPYLRHDRAGDMTLEPGSITVRDGVIVALEDDPAADLRLDATGCAVIPGFVDCHTHLPFAGWRAGEYEQKVTGVPYEEIARSGGGIAASARALAEASDAAVLEQAAGVARDMHVWGTTAFECKSGYGLGAEQELRALRLARELEDFAPQDALAATALLAHAIPPGRTADGWMEEVAALVPRVAAEGLAQALDIYVESIAFENRHLERMGELAAAHGLWLRAHVEQFATHRSVPVALAAGARSVDHLACLHPDDLAPLARAECAAVLLPGAEFLGDERTAPGRALAQAGAICVVATDCNPGTSPLCAMPVVIGLAVRRYGWSVREALLAATLNPAWVLGLSREQGSIEVGKRANLVILDGPAEHVPYRFGRHPVAGIIQNGMPMRLAESLVPAGQPW
jgi:imidazolonepropionase